MEWIGSGIDEYTLLCCNFDYGLIDNAHDIIPQARGGMFNVSSAQKKWGIKSLDATTSTNSYLAYPIETTANDITVEWWEYCTVNQNVNGFLYLSTEEGAEGQGILIHCLNNSAIGCYAGNNKNWGYLSGYNTLITRKYNTWSHKAFVWDRKNGLIKFYEDGTLKTQTSLPNFNNIDLNYLYLSGRPIAPTQYWGTYVDDIRVSSIARYSGDTYEVPKNPFEKPKAIPSGPKDITVKNKNYVQEGLNTIIFNLGDGLDKNYLYDYSVNFNDNFSSLLIKNNFITDSEIPSENDIIKEINLPLCANAKGCYITLTIENKTINKKIPFKTGG